MRLSQGPTLVPNTTNVNIEKKRPASTTLKTSSQKRARLDDNNDNDKENRIREHVVQWEKENPVDNDEKALMDDLMAGLDASMFEGLANSPVKSQALSQVNMSPARVREGKLERISPVKSRVKVEHRSPLRPSITNRPIIAIPKALGPPKNEIKRVPKAFVPIKLELEENIKPIQEIKVDVKPVLEDDDEFTFDFDLDELAGMDDDLLLKPHVAAKVGPYVWSWLTTGGISNQEPRSTRPTCWVSLNPLGEMYC
jgi:hypothetical protein